MSSFVVVEDVEEGSCECEYKCSGGPATTAREKNFNDAMREATSHSDDSMKMTTKVWMKPTTRNNDCYYYLPMSLNFYDERRFHRYHSGPERKKIRFDLLQLQYHSLGTLECFPDA